MMLRNFHYDQSLLKPEWLVLNTLAQLIEIVGERLALREVETPVG